MGLTKRRFMRKDVIVSVDDTGEGHLLVMAPKEETVRYVEVCGNQVTRVSFLGTDIHIMKVHEWLKAHRRGYTCDRCATRFDEVRLMPHGSNTTVIPGPRPRHHG